MIKNIDTIVFQFDKLKVLYDFDIRIDSVLLDVDYTLGDPNSTVNYK